VAIFVAVLVVLFFGIRYAIAAPADSRERIYQERFCVRMQLEYKFPDGTRADCLSDRYVIEVDFTEKWAESIGQALHYMLWPRDLPIGERRAGIILVCRHAREICTDHTVRLKRVIEAFNLPVTVWDCDRDDAPPGALSDADC
jgi:hypothetical protein